MIGEDPEEVEATATVKTEEAAAKLSITKAADPTEGVAVGDTITYTVVVKNVGNVSVEAGKLDDDHADLSAETTQADVDAGSIENTVTAKGKDPKNADVTGTATATVTTEEAAAELTVTKTADPTSGVKVGDTVTYTVVVTNSGNVTVTAIAMSDSLVTLSEEAFELAPKASKTITYTYSVTQADGILLPMEKKVRAQ